jgi:Tfp pilus assembly pilus retraction ATPase PilT
MDTLNKHVARINCALDNFEMQERALLSHMRSDPDLIVLHRVKADDVAMHDLAKKAYESGHDVLLTQAAYPQ